jgi:hypothetical protein
MSVTALQLIEAAMSKLRKLAAGETVSAEDADLGLRRLNSLMTYLENEGMFNYTTTRTVATLPASTTSRTIGAAQQIAMVRPVEILKGSYSRLNSIDYPLTPVSEQEYNAISLKSSVGSVAPVVCFYDGGTPTGNVYFWPTAATAVELHLITPAPGGEAVDTTTVYNFPPGYQRMVENNLALELAPDFNVEPSAMVVKTAASSKRALRRTNQTVPQLDLDGAALSRHGNSPSDFIGGYY